ncbi:dTDP-3-amino-3,4,6-trideoxy-alpha-D-glucopyranose [Symmachiella macrocystis]|uniref:dTDP-3-amino-3,4, 6-trideoxy-alpha-D-glucopyranose n=1 Tax=Symmachiella macrocystis TaxID=2527985 RepID=A0A5C6B6P4_9PLAN|nr:class I SAM-dependent methyltransferase [Symmachiella macrocystis]TWU07222.1 dTDP-3-amino-3,4,6-trideoxy-alpha-D-glucopyranose [Symmachiella macrocystis]
MPQQSNTNSLLYRDDLAEIHVDGYGFHWTGAADSILEWFSQYGICSGKVVDLGCGGGQWLAHLDEHGYETYGIDVSESMIRIASRNAPNSELQCGSFADVAIPKCDAVTSLGEPLNYLNSRRAMQRTLRKVFAALRPGGVFIFDVRHPAKGAVAPQSPHRISEDWCCLAHIEEDFRKNLLTRHITTFRRQKDGKYHRDTEVHRLKVFSRSDVSAWLRATGFRVRTKTAYGTYQLSKRQSIFICRKPE